MNFQDIKKIIEDVLERMGVDYTEVLFDEKDNRARFLVKSSDSSLLIGGGGENLRALNYLIKRMLPEEEKAYFIVDVEDYFLQKIDKVKYAARVSAERAKFLKEDVEMEPMSSYERMVVHSTLADDPQITTESKGFGRSRRVTISFNQPNKDSNNNF